MFDKKFFTTAGIIIISLFLFAIFPASGAFQQMVSSLTFLLVIPVLYIKIVLKENLPDYGVQKGNWKKGLVWGGFSLLAALAVLYLAINYTAFPQKYSPPDIVKKSFVLFIPYEILFVGFFATLYEFFYRGIAMLGLFRKFGYMAILGQFIIFLAFLAITGNISWKFAPYLVASPLAGITAYQSRSLYWSFGVSLLFVVITDAVIIALAP